MRLKPNIPPTASSILFSFAIINNLQRLFLPSLSFNMASASFGVRREVVTRISASRSSASSLAASTSSFVMPAVSRNSGLSPPIKIPILSGLVDLIRFARVALSFFNFSSVMRLGAPSVTIRFFFTFALSCFGAITRSNLFMPAMDDFIIIIFLALSSRESKRFTPSVDAPHEIITSAYAPISFS